MNDIEIELVMLKMTEQKKEDIIKKFEILNDKVKNREMTQYEYIKEFDKNYNELYKASSLADKVKLKLTKKMSDQYIKVMDKK
jgi:phospholipid N-methyltransferase